MARNACIVIASTLIWSSLAFAQVAETGAREAEPVSEKLTAEQPPDKPEAATIAEADPASKEFKPPPGFRKKKRGKHVLYCIQDSTVGTRFKTEKCYDEEQMKHYLLAREQNNRDFDQRRSICSNPKACGMP